MGLTEFEIHHKRNIVKSKARGSISDDKANSRPNNEITRQQELKLSRTICVNGWLTDKHDFDRPFGVTPESLTDKHELLCRFCSVYAPEVIPKCGDILKEWKGKEDDLWD